MGAFGRDLAAEKKARRSAALRQVRKDSPTSTPTVAKTEAPATGSGKPKPKPRAKRAKG